MEVGGWVGPGVTRILFFLELYTLLKVVSYYDLSVLPMSVMDFQHKKKC